MLCRRHQRTQAQAMNPNAYANRAYEYPASVASVGIASTYDTLNAGNNNTADDEVFYRERLPSPTVADDEQYDYVSEEPPDTSNTFTDDQVYDRKLPSSCDTSPA